MFGDLTTCEAVLLLCVYLKGMYSFEDEHMKYMRTQVLGDGFKDFVGAEQALVKALLVSPDDVTVLHTYGVLLWRAR